MSRVLTKKEWRRRRRIKNRIMLTLALLLMIMILMISIFLLREIASEYFNIGKNTIETLSASLTEGLMIEQQYLTPNDYSRPEIPLKKIRGVVIHYTANPNTSAQNNRNYFESLAEKETTSASSHYIIGLEGEIIQCIPMTEIAYASNERNADTISIECCHPDTSGKFTKATYEALVSLTAALCVEFDLQEKDIIRHYDVTGKLCPLYFVEHEDDWKRFKREVMIEAVMLESRAELIDKGH
ncbi:MAG: N-acetylmuramoyl-L-alanine amidase [Clostridiales bacterium]|jgi:N-acetylmuramoyl-L-alanine amidase|nr:N-acetylmuramoyl-L-alanine amidase [Clostridiales bacterium]